MRKKKVKKASMPYYVLIGIIASIIVFLIGILFYDRLALGDIVDKEACHESALLRHTANLDPTEKVKAKVLLHCQTQKICFNAGNRLTRIFSPGEGSIAEKSSGKCQEFADKKSGVETISVSSSPAQAREEIIAKIADEMASCWQTVGEGYLDYSPRESQQQVFCSMCARIAFDKSIKNFAKLDRITYGDLFSYMQNHTVPALAPTKQVSYLEYLYGRKSLNTINEDIKRAVKEGTYNKDLSQNPAVFGNGNNVNIFDMEIATDKEYAIITKFSKIGFNKPLMSSLGGAGLGAAAGLVVVTALTGGIGTVALFTIAGGAYAGQSIIFSDEFNNIQSSRPSIIPYTPEDLKRYQCTSFEFIP